MLQETFKLFDDTMKMFEKEMKNLSEGVFKNFKGKTKVKIKKGSKIYVNGVYVTLLTDTIVATDDPEKLMKTGN